MAQRLDAGQSVNVEGSSKFSKSLAREMIDIGVDSEKSGEKVEERVELVECAGKCPRRDRRMTHLIVQH